MININIPGYHQLFLDILVLDYNGTLALDGIMPRQIRDKLTDLAKLLDIHIVTSDTFGSVTNQCQGLPLKVKVLETDNHTTEKADYLDQFGKSMIVAIGNGANDHLMLKKASLSIAVLGKEGCANKALNAAEIVVNDINDALDLLIHPQRLIATLRC